MCDELDVPFYLHPRNPLPQDARIYKGAEWLLGPIWAFGHETAVHALRLMGSGLFDKHPKLQIVLGHMGEGLPFNIWRVDNANAWIPNRNHYPAKKKIGEYFQNNFHITVSGNFCTQALLDRADGERLRPHHVLDRLAVREHRPRRGVVRRRADRRGGPPEDRPHQCAEAVQAEGRLSDAEAAQPACLPLGDSAINPTPVYVNRAMDDVDRQSSASRKA